MSEQFLKNLEVRRTYYNLTPISTIPDSKIKSILEAVVLHAPSAFNTQTARLVLVTGARHKKLWQIVQETYSSILGGNAEAIAAAKLKFETEYEAAYGTVLFFEDISIVEGMQAKMPAIAHTFPIWSENATGMAQYAVWVALALEGMGASLQHHGSFAPSTAPAILKEFGLPETWKSTALMPFGVASGEPGKQGHPKTFTPVEARVLQFLDTDVGQEKI